MRDITIKQFYEDLAAVHHIEVGSLLPRDIQKEIGHFNIFNVEELLKTYKERPEMPYDRRAYYKISLIKGRNKAEYSDRVFEIEDYALLFATPKVPYHWVPQDMNQGGYFCIFTEDFLVQSKSGILLDELPIFKPGGYPVFQVTAEEATEIAYIFRKMEKDLASDYLYKYDLLRTYVLELIHYGQKLQPATAMYQTHNAAGRIASLFIELLERQFPISSPQQRLTLRTAKDYADRLSVHVNHLNKVLKENMGKTTSELVTNRVIQEAKILLKQTNWTVSEIGYSLGFEEVAHFSNFFRRQTKLAPVQFRS